MEMGAVIVQSWMNSSGHRINILSEKYDKIGFGVAFDGKTYYYATQDFWYIFTLFYALFGIHKYPYPITWPC